MVTVQEFLARIDGFLSGSGMTASAFGRAAVNDPNLVGDLRSGRMPNLRTLSRVNDFIESHPSTSPIEPEAA